MLRRLALVLCLAFCVPSAPAAAAGDSAEIIAESARSLEEGGNRVAGFWWLPQEYWEAAAKELALSPADQEKVRTIFRDYTMVGVLDARISTDKKPEFASIADVVKRSTFRRNGEPVQVLREVNPELQRIVPSLVYLLKASLGGLGEGLRLLPLANVDPQGKPILRGAGRGELDLEFRFEEGSAPHVLRWRTPFTSIAGARKCPQGGEPLEASWDYCPWHGVKAAPAN